LFLKPIKNYTNKNILVL